MSRFAYLAVFLITLRSPREFKDTRTGQLYWREWSLLTPMSYDEWLYWHFDPVKKGTNPLAEYDEWDDDDDVGYVEERGPPETALTDAEALAQRDAALMAKEEAAHQRRMQKLGELDRKVRALAALRGVYMMPTPKEKA